MSVIQRAQAIGMLRAMSIRDVANHFNVHRRTIERLKDKFNQTADITDAQRSGSPRKTNQPEDRNIIVSHRRSRFTETALQKRHETGSETIKLAIKLS